MKSPKNKKMRTKEDGGMSLWSRLRFAIDFDDDDNTLVTSSVFNRNLQQAIQTLCSNYANSSIASTPFKLWYDRSQTTYISFKRPFRNTTSSSSSPAGKLATDIIGELIKLDSSLSGKKVDIEGLIESLFIETDISEALFVDPTGGVKRTQKQPITAMERVLIAQLCNDKLKNAINGASLGITVADGRGIRRNKLTTRKSRGKDGRKSRSPNRR